MSAPILSKLPLTPLNTWRGLGELDKYSWYTRLSLQAMPFAVCIGLIVGVITGSDSPVSINWRSIIGIAYLTVLVGFTFVIYELHPDLNTRTRRPVQWYFRSGLAVTVAGLIAAQVFQLPSFSLADRQAAVVVSAFSLCTLALVYIPWLKFHWLIIVVLTFAVGLIAQQTVPHSYFLWTVPPLLTMTLRLSIWTINLMKQVQRSREIEASLVVTEERLRFAQELHDTLGQHLAAMSVKTELALAFAQRGDERLEKELRELQQLARTSMSEMREVVHGYRSINLATEVAGAWSLLNDANINLEIHGDALDVPAVKRELAAWLVREAITNILRHSDATIVQLYLGSTEVRIENDGALETIGPLSGLSSLSQRAESEGAALLVERKNQRFILRLVEMKEVAQ